MGLVGVCVCGWLAGRGADRWVGGEERREMVMMAAVVLVLCCAVCCAVCVCVYVRIWCWCCRTASTQLANGGRNDPGCVCVCVCLGCVYVMATPHTDITHHHDSLHCKRKRRTDGGSAHFYKRRTSHKYTIDTHTHTRLLRLLAFLSFRQKIRFLSLLARWHFAL